MTILTTSAPQISADQQFAMLQMPNRAQNSPGLVTHSEDNALQRSNAAVAAVAKPTSSADNHRSVKQPRTSTKLAPMELVQLPSGTSVYKRVEPNEDWSAPPRTILDVLATRPVAWQPGADDSRTPFYRYGMAPLSLGERLGVALDKAFPDDPALRDALPAYGTSFEIDPATGRLVIELPFYGGLGEVTGRGLLAAPFSAGERVEKYYEGMAGMVRPNLGIRENHDGDDEGETRTVVVFEDPLRALRLDALGLKGYEFIGLCGDRYGWAPHGQAFGERDVLAIYDPLAGETGAACNRFVSEHFVGARHLPKESWPSARVVRWDFGEAFCEEYMGSWNPVDWDRADRGSDDVKLDSLLRSPLTASSVLARISDPQCGLITGDTLHGARSGSVEAWEADRQDQIRPRKRMYAD